MKAPSVISSLRRCGGRPDSVSAYRTWSTKSGWRSWTTDTLTAMRRCRPALSQATAWLQAVRSTQLPRATMKPLSPAR